MGAIVKRGTKDKPRFYIQYRDVDGVRRTKRIKSATTKAQAEVFLKAAETRVERNQVGLEPIKEPTPEERSRAAITLKELAARFLGDVKDVAGYAPPRIKNIRTYRGDARSALKVRVLPTLGTRPASSIVTADVEQLRDAMIADERAGATVVQTLAVLSKLYTWAIRAGHVDCANPVHGVERPRTNATIDYLDRGEVGRLLAKVDELAAASPSCTWEARVRAPMVATAIYAGLRKGELFGLRWIDVHLDTARLDVARSYRLAPKSGKARHLPLHPELVRILRAWKDVCPKTDDDLVFPVIGDGPRGRWHMGDEQDALGLEHALVAAGCHLPVDGKCWHLLRHTFASHAVMSGTSLYEVQRLLGHATPTMTQRYAHLAPSHLASSVARLSFAQPSPEGVADLGEERRKRAAGDDSIAAG